LAAAVGYLLTGYEPLLALAVAQHLEMALQALPLLRFDGHFIISDLIGVPDAMSRVRPALAGMLPGRPEPAAISELTPRARKLLRAYAAITFPALAAILVVVILSVPAILGRAVDTMTRSVGQLPGADAVGAAGALGRIGLALLPVIGVAFTLFLIARRVARGGAGTPALIAAQVLEGLLIGLVALYASFYLAVGGETDAVVPALGALLALGTLAAWPPRRAHKARDPQLRRLRERRGF
jgi:putative peptide zinc metalloprotease protein